MNQPVHITHAATTPAGRPATVSLANDGFGDWQVRASCDTTHLKAQGVMPMRLSPPTEADIAAAEADALRRLDLIIETKP